MKYTSESPCVVCGVSPTDLHHFKTRKSNGSDHTQNLLPLCREHHTEVHKIGATTFSKKHAKVKQWLMDNGWKHDDVLLKWYNPNAIKL